MGLQLPEHFRQARRRLTPRFSGRGARARRSWQGLLARAAPLSASAVGRLWIFLNEMIFTALQGQYLSFIHNYTKIHGRPPSEAEMQRYFAVTPPSVHQMILALERKGLISRSPGKARSIRVLLSPSEIPPLT